MMTAFEPTNGAITQGNTLTTRKLADLRDHEAAAPVPAMQEAEYADLLADVKVHGVQVPLDILPDGRVLDGRNRRRAALDAGLAEVPVRVLDLNEEEAGAHIIRTAVLRRNLNDDQRAVLLARMQQTLTQVTQTRRAQAAAQARWQDPPCSEDTSSPKHAEDGQAREGEGRTREVLARQGNVPERKLKSAIQLEKESPDLAAKVLAGEMKLNAAWRTLRRRQKRTELAAKAEAAARNGTGGSWEIVQGNCLEVLARVEAGTARLLFADPPYNEGVDYGGGRKADRLPENRYLAWCRAWMAECARVLSLDGSMWVLISEDYADHVGLLLREVGLHRRRWIVWEESFGVHQQKNFSRSARHLFYTVKDRRHYVFNEDAVRTPSARQTLYGDKRADPDGRILPNVLHIPRVAGTHPERIEGFPTQLPLALLRLVVGCASDPGDLVIDPFSGSATTGMVCVELGRRYLGIEKQAEFVELSRQRLMALNVTTNDPKGTDGAGPGESPSPP
jgi:site-specific DNA-methyltransferase (adenine-specific)